jgi:hypothetical protein
VKNLVLSILYLISTLILFGCAQTPEDMHASLEKSYEFTIKENYHAVYRNIFRGAKHCHSEMDVKLNNFPDIKKAEVDIYLMIASKKHSLYTADITPISADATKVRVDYFVYSAGDTWGKGAHDFKKWANGDVSYCYRKVLEKEF